jgi:Na+-translocating ferredoxin:NAD+ oxidoreductase subunit B
MDMNIANIAYASLSLGGIGLVLGLGLGFASKKFAVEEDPRIGLVKAALPGANCGACGYPGCDALANAIVAGEVGHNGCPVGGAKCAKQIGEILGVEVAEVVETEKTSAFVKCSGSNPNRKNKYEYAGVKTCAEAARMETPDSKDCSFGCMGLGCCVSACKFDAIAIVDGVAVVDEEKCVSCGACIKACPKSLIEIVPVAKGVRVACSSTEKGKVVRDACSVGCIGCTLCVKACQFDAIIFENNLAKVDYDKCTQCQACFTKCPTKAIQSMVYGEAAATNKN